MINAKVIEELTKNLLGLLPGNFTVLKHDLEINVKQCVKATLAKFDLVTREEFDAQIKVLAAAQTKLAELEQALAELEKNTQ